VALGLLCAVQGRWLDADEHYREAFRCDDGDPTTHQTYGLHVAGTLGLLKRYLRNALEARALAPASPVTLMNLAVAHSLNGQIAECREALEAALAIGMLRTLAPVPDVRSELALQDGRRDDAAAIIVESLPQELRDAGAGGIVERVFAAFDDPDLRPAAIDTLVRLREQGGDTMPQFARRRLIVWHTRLGSLDEAFRILNGSLDHFTREGTIGSAWAFLWMRSLLPLRRDPRFQAVAERMHFFDYWTRHGPPDNCELRDGRLVCN
jgi:hypothetical protein